MTAALGSTTAVGTTKHHINPFKPMSQPISYREIDLWVREELSQHGEWLVDRFIEAIERGGNVDTGALVESFDYSTSSSQGSQTLTVSFNLYGRLAEVRSRRTRSATTPGESSLGKNRSAWARKNHHPKRVQWYNRNRYAGYSRLIRRLTAGMSDAELTRIRSILLQAKVDFTASK